MAALVASPAPMPLFWPMFARRVTSRLPVPRRVTGPVKLFSPLKCGEAEPFLTIATLPVMSPVKFPAPLLSPKRSVAMDAPLLVMVPAPLRELTALVPEVAVPKFTPLRSKVAPWRTVRPMPVPPRRPPETICSVPSLTATVPVYALAPPRTRVPAPLLARPAVLTVIGVLMVRVFAPPSTRIEKSLPAADAASAVPPLMVLFPPVSKMPLPAPTPTVRVCPAARVRLLAPSIFREFTAAVVWAVIAPVIRLWLEAVSVAAPPAASTKPASVPYTGARRVVPAPENAKSAPLKYVPALRNPEVPVTLTVPELDTLREAPAVRAPKEAKVSVPEAAVRVPCPAVAVSAPAVSVFAPPVYASVPPAAWVKVSVPKMTAPASGSRSMPAPSVSFRVPPLTVVEPVKVLLAVGASTQVPVPIF